MPPLARLFPACAGLIALASLAAAQQPAPAIVRIEPGLEEAVKWKWKAVSSPPADWGLALPEPPPPTPLNAPAPSMPLRDSADSYTVKKGDALILISKKFGITVEQLKYANGLTSTVIRVGDVLKIPTPEEIARMPLTTAAPAPQAKLKSPDAGPSSPTAPAAQFDPDILLFQIYLDRLNYSPGPIDGKTGIRFQKLMFLFQSANEDSRDIDALRTRACSDVSELFTSYKLKPEDFRFIAPPKAEKATPPAPNTPAPKTQKKAAPAPVKPAAPLSYPELTGAQMLAYRSPWEFVAERFHCDEMFLRSINPNVPPLPAAGADFRVPNVHPFEIEKFPPAPLQPPADPSRATTAVIVDLNRLEIYQNDRLVAMFPLSAARPALRGRSEWVILNALAKPRLATLREPREKPRPASNFFVGQAPETAEQTPILPNEEFLPAGPNNPVGVVWINLAKAGDPEPLPFGLHGTSIPDQMMVQESLGGFRLTNWDIARAVQLLPEGTKLLWKQSTPPSVQSAQPAR